MDRKLTILHVTPHLGGGVGKVVLNYLSAVNCDKDYIHKIACLDYANESALTTARDIGFTLIESASGKKTELLRLIAAADVVFVHWWNHPLLYDLLVRTALPPCRMVMWSHISGLYPPYVFTSKILHYPDLFVFTTPVSFETSEVRALPDVRKKQLRAIWSTGGIDHVKNITPKSHDGFNIGYVGTVDYCKMHRDYLKMSSLINVPDAQCIVCGGPNDEQIGIESLQYHTGMRFTFTGQVSNVSDYLDKFDVFGYPLAPFHYGTCEQSLGESMAAGIPPVVLANRTESMIVKDGVTGLIAANDVEYVRAIELLYYDRELHRRLSIQAQRAAAELYSLDKLVTSWNEVFTDIVHLDKGRKKWNGIDSGFNVPAYQVFLESLGEYDKAFLRHLHATDERGRNLAKAEIGKLFASNNIWRSTTRGTPGHYHSFYPEDSYLEEWCDLAGRIELELNRSSKD